MEFNQQPQRRRRSRRQASINARERLGIVTNVVVNDDNQEDLELSQIIDEGNSNEIEELNAGIHEQMNIEEQIEDDDLLIQIQQQQQPQQQPQQEPQQEPQQVPQQQHHPQEQPQQQPQQQQQQQQMLQQIPQTQNYGTQRFLAKIPNIKVLREFLVNKGGYYAPPIKDMTNNFCRLVLAGKKKLMKTKEVLWVDQVPNWPEFSSKNLWLKAKSNPQVAIYFPDFSQSRLPQRKYLLNIANTVGPNSVIEAVFNIRKQRENQGIDSKPIILTNEFADLFNQFVSISSDQKRGGLRLVQPKNFDQCILCLYPMDNLRIISNFTCLRHKAHTRCISRYLKSEMGKKSEYLCPSRCRQPQ